MRLKSLALAAFMILGLTQLAQAQTVPVAPRTGVFTLSQADFDNSASWTEEFYQCGSVVVSGSTVNCVGRALAPFQAGVVIPKSAVTSSGTDRSYSLTVAPSSGILGSMPNGIGFVATLKSNGDTSIPGVGGQSVASPDSNPFFAAARTPASPTNVRVQQ